MAIEEAGPFVERVAALDIGKAGLVACLRVPAEGGGSRRRQEVTDWTTMTADLVNLADYLVCQGVELVVMEATGVIRRRRGAVRDGGRRADLSASSAVAYGLSGDRPSWGQPSRQRVWRSSLLGAAFVPPMAYASVTAMTCKNPRFDLENYR
ncbi:hypothetical protein [Pseudofrankia sp. BMG5.37]|uniref:hypothetical protein n=1 Tax=Pseudofrankia sp. BMG5.37 TaxID=3050035 RepID=UPI0028960220|nr:hypothetical protein [Pseudofrankia sp. BMG5.37]MDT3445606.1 hypothetical protein [Pseudofrankia sp. BMG5.37]